MITALLQHQISISSPIKGFCCDNFSVINPSLPLLYIVSPHNWRTHLHLSLSLSLCAPFVLAHQSLAMGLSLSRKLISDDFVNFLSSFSSEKINTPGKVFPVQLEDMVNLVSRTGRHLQRYEKGCRQVVGCIPYRYKITSESTNGESTAPELEFLMISSQKGVAMMFPKGGWETDESMEDAALRETMEEAGVMGKVEKQLGQWRYKSKSQGTYHDGHMFPLLVKKQLDCWPEKNVRQRRWVSAAEAKEVCKQVWMKEALDVLVCRLMQQQSGESLEVEEPCPLQ